jgi:hypothetical protein
MLKIPLSAVAYALSYQFAYIFYLNPEFEYAGFRYYEPSLAQLGFAYVAIAAPFIGYRPKLTPSSVGAALIGAIYYIPSQLILLFVWEGAEVELALLQSGLAISMGFILQCSSKGMTEPEQIAWQGTGDTIALPQGLRMAVGALTVVSLLLVFGYYGSQLQLTSFEDIYDLRSEAFKVDLGPAINYSTTWLLYAFLPFYFAYGLLRRNLKNIAIGLAISVLFYSIAGHKTAILMGVAVLGLYGLLGFRENFLFALLVSLAGILIVLTLVPATDGPLFWAKSIFIVRMLSTGGWCLSMYYEFFSTNPLTYYTHIGIISALTGAYPYTGYALGQVIGLEYFGSIEANFNAGFWASDAVAALGWLGVPIVTAAVCLVEIFINRFSRGYSTRFVALWLTGYWQTVLNVPLSTALLSGGGILIMTLLAVFETRRLEVDLRPEISSMVR